MSKIRIMSIFSRKNKDIKEAKKLLLETFFNPEKQRDVVARAARESAEDQRRMLQKANLKLKAR